MATVETHFEDLDGDGRLEFIAYGNTMDSVGAGLQRKRTEVYSWDGEVYRLSRLVRDPSDHIYFLMLDANAALASGELDQALKLAMQAVNKPPAESGQFRWDLEYTQEWEEVRIVSFAAIEAMLVHAVRHEAEAIQMLLREVEAKYDREDNPYVEAARRLWATYQATQDPVAACQAVERTAREHLDQARFFRWYGYNMERLSLEQVCPLDGDLGSEGERVDL